MTLAVEHYNRMVRLIEHNVPVKVELDVRVQFHENQKGFNVVVAFESPGRIKAVPVAWQFSISGREVKGL